MHLEEHPGSTSVSNKKPALRRAKVPEMTEQANLLTLDKAYRVPCLTSASVTEF